MAARTVSERKLMQLADTLGLHVLDAEIADYSAGDALPTLTSLSDANNKAVALQPHGIYVGVSVASLKVTHVGGTVVTYPNLPVGFHPIVVTRIWNAGSTAGANTFFLYGSSRLSGG